MRLAASKHGQVPTSVVHVGALPPLGSGALGAGPLLRLARGRAALVEFKAPAVARQEIEDIVQGVGGTPVVPLVGIVNGNGEMEFPLPPVGGTPLRPVREFGGGGNQQGPAPTATPQAARSAPRAGPLSSSCAEFARCRVR